ncbi:hypothetical protein MPNTM1_03846 [Mycolicibacterium parafortuitum]
MRRSFRKAGVACGAVFASATVALSAATGAQAVNTAVAVGGLGTPDMHEIVISPLLGGKLARENDVLDGVEWPAQAGPYTGRNDMTLGQSITAGIISLDAHFDAAMLAANRPGDVVTVVGFSAGSLVVNDWMRTLINDPDAPDKDEVKFILVADSSRQKLLKDSQYNPRYDYTYLPAPQTIYDIDVVTGEYDGAADLPDRWWNFLALANAVAGGIFVHVPMMLQDYEAVTPEENITRVTNDLGGTTTTYLVPTKKLPLVQLLPFLAPREAELKAMIDKGYSRNDNRTTTAGASSAAALAAPAVVQESVADEDDAATAEKASAETDTDTADAPKKRTSAKPAVSDDDSDSDADAAKDADTDKADADADTDTDTADKADTVRKAGKSGTKGGDDDGAKGSTSSADTDSSAGSSSQGSGSSDSGSSE